MTTAIRLYRTYILSTFVPLNTIRRASGLSTKLTLVIIQKQHKSQRKAGFYMVMEGFLLRPKRSEFIRPLFIYCPAIFFADDLQLPFVCGEDNILYICPTPMNACARSVP